MSILRFLLFPFAIIYAVVILIRNFLFDFGIIMEKDVILPTVSVGNISTGGTGKTPFMETLIELFTPSFDICVLSRGYGRKTHGFLWVETDSRPEDVGDEILQLKQKYPKIPMAVCESRVEGAKHMYEESQANLLLLDDAFQHRYIARDFDIVLTTYQKPFWKDYLLPMGNLREFRWSKSRANAIVITKCPPGSTRKSLSKMLKRIKPNIRQMATFAISTYDEPKHLFNHEISDLKDYESCLVVTGIADNKGLLDHISEKGKEVRELRYKDHANYSRARVESIVAKWRAMNEDKPSCIITTPKDAVKLREVEEALRDVPVFVVDYKLELGEAHALRSRMVPHVIRL